MNKTHHHVEKPLSVGIVGCGWLGKVLAASLQAKKIPVLATSSKPENVAILNQQSIIAQKLMLPADIATLAQHDIFTQHSLVIAITPQFRQGRTDYADKIAQLVSAAQQRGVVERIILLSSTAVYEGLSGIVEENSELDFSTEKVKVLHAAELAVINFCKQGIVLRLAGLVGPNRHPGKFIQAKKTLSNSSAPVNLIHQQDAVGLIKSLLQVNLSQLSLAQENMTGTIFNGVSDTHISKREYYQAAAKALKVDAPNVEKARTNENTRVVSGEKAKRLLSYKFVYPDLLTWL
jgi:nucleoside-diphosphate-sugar epimerase